LCVRALSEEALALAAKAEQPFFLLGWYRSARKFIKEAMHELREVVWPSGDELKQYTILVVSLLVGVSVFIGLWQFVFQWFFGTILDIYGKGG
jgi:preprotein translocase SecE subunit